MRYEDFFLEFGPPYQNRAYPVSVRSPAGTGSGSFLDPLPAGGSEPGTPLELTGGTLFSAVFHGEVRDLYTMSLGMMEAQPGTGLRIQINIDPADTIASHPWEVLFDTIRHQFLALDPRTPITRSLGVPRPPRTAKLNKPLSILAVPSNPRDLPPLDLKRECRNLKAACAKNPNVRLEFLKAPCTPEAIQTKLRGNSFQILHFMGHGGIDHAGKGRLFLQTSKRLSLEVSADELKNLIGEFDLRFIFLNACNTAPFGTQNPFAGVAAALVLRGFPAVLAMRSVIEDEAAIRFSRTFFQVLLEERPTEVAIQAGRIVAQLASPDSEDWSLPILFLRSQETHRFRSIITLIIKCAAGLVLPILALTLWLLWRPSEISIDIPVEGSSVSTLTEVIVHGPDRPGENYYLLVRDPDRKCWLQGRGPLKFDGGEWRDHVQLLGDPGDSYDIFIVSSPDLLPPEPQRPNGSYCYLLPDGTRAVRHVTLGAAKGRYDRSQ